MKKSIKYILGMLLWSILSFLLFVQCTDSVKPKVDDLYKFTGTFKGTLNLHSEDGQINDNIFETWIITKSGNQLTVSRKISSGYSDIPGTVSNNSLSLSQKTSQTIVSGYVVTLVLGPGQSTLNGSILSVDVPFSITYNNIVTPGSLVGNLLKQ
jgi:hypothetical protein